MQGEVGGKIHRLFLAVIVSFIFLNKHKKVFDILSNRI